MFDKTVKLNLLPILLVNITIEIGKRQDQSTIFQNLAELITCLHIKCVVHSVAQAFLL